MLYSAGVLPTIPEISCQSQETKGGGGDYAMIKPFLHLQFVQEVLQSHGCMRVWSLNQLPGMQSINTF